MATFLDTVCYGFDYAILEAIHAFALATGGALDWFFTAVTHLADDGLGMIALGLILCLFRRTRKCGVAVLGAIIVGALITNVTLKPLIMRARPYTHKEFIPWWQAMGAHVESDRSFPSGHTTSAMAAMMGVFLTNKKKYSWTALLFALLMGFTRLYRVVHYPTDVVGGLIAGALGGVIAYFIVAWLWRVLEAHREKRLFAFALDFDPVASGCRWLCAKCGKKQTEDSSEAAPDKDSDQPNAE